MRRLNLPTLAAAALLTWGLYSSADAGGQQIVPSAGTDGAAVMAQASSSPGSAAAGGSPGATGAAATASPAGATAGAAAASSPSSTTGAASQAGQQITDQELQQHARAHEALDQKAPDLFGKFKTSKDPAADFTADERQKFEMALQGTGVSFQEFARVHAQIVSDQQVRGRFAQIAQQSKAQAGAAQSPASTSGAAAASSPAGTTSGAAPSGAEPGASPK
jgi:hypothetical protein